MTLYMIEETETETKINNVIIQSQVFNFKPVIVDNTNTS